MSFWADKINGEQPKQVVLPNRDLFALHNPINTPQQYQQQQSIPNQEYQVRNGIPLVKGGMCPGCGSDKYMQHGSYAVACGECGYHPRFQQSTYGLPSLAGDKSSPVAAARQTSDSQTMQGSMVLLNTGGGDHIRNL